MYNTFNPLFTFQRVASCDEFGPRISTKIYLFWPFWLKNMKILIIFHDSIDIRRSLP